MKLTKEELSKTLDSKLKETLSNLYTETRSNVLVSEGKNEKIDHDKGTVTMSKQDYAKTHKDFKGKNKSGPTILRMGKKGTTPYNVIFEDDNLEDQS